MKKRIKLGNLMMGSFMLIILIAASSFTEASAQTSLVYHSRLQKENTFENRMKSNESFTMKSLKEDNKALKDKLKESGKAKKFTSKRKDLKNENSDLRARIEDLKID